MLTAALDGLVARFGLAGERSARSSAGAVLKHSRDFNLTRESVLGSALDPRDPRLRRPAGVRHRPPGGHPGRQQDRARADRLRRSPAASTPPATRRSASTTTCAGCCWRLDRGQVARRPARALGARPPAPPRARHPAQRRAAHRAVDGRARRADRAAVGHHPRGAGRAGRRQPPAARRRVRPRLLRRPGHARTSGSTRDQNLRPDSSLEKLARLKPVFGAARRRDDDRRQLHAADRRRRGGPAGDARSGRPRAACRSLALPRRTPRPRRSTSSTATRGC